MLSQPAISDLSVMRNAIRTNMVRAFSGALVVPFSNSYLLGWNARIPAA